MKQKQVENRPREAAVRVHIRTDETFAFTAEMDLQILFRATLSLSLSYPCGA